MDKFKIKRSSNTSFSKIRVLFIVAITVLVLTSPSYSNWFKTLKITAVVQGNEYKQPCCNIPPVADANGPYTGYVGIPIIFNGSGSYDEDGRIVSYRWNFGDGKIGLGVSTSHIYTTPGVYNVTLTVNDNCCNADSDKTTVTVNEQNNDRDDDGVPDDEDAFPDNPSEWEDTDNDGIGDNADSDDDNDGYTDADENACGSDPKDPTSIPVNTDNDLIPDCIDSDDDNDGVTDDQDAFPYDPTEWEDTDNDGTGDNADIDDDNDGYLDDNELACGSDPLDSSSIPIDFDGDLIPDCVDLDDDNDGVPDNEDMFPYDPTESEDTDNDGIGDNADIDDDNDGVLDGDDAFPGDPLEWEDTDNDGIGNNADTDDDNDGIPDNEDAFPYDPTEWEDTDNDGTGDNADSDDDNDGVPDDEDAFPDDPSEWEDTDGDGIGNNADTDDNSGGNNNFKSKKTQTISNNPPVANANGPYYGIKGQPTIFNGSGNYDPDNDKIFYFWDFGDGKNSTDENPVHIYLNTGNYTVKLKLSDERGKNDTDKTYAIIIEKPNNPPTANFFYSPINPTTDDTIQFTDSSRDIDGNIISWSWEFSDGTTSTEKNPKHKYNEIGAYLVTLKVKDDDGNINILSKAILVEGSHNKVLSGATKGTLSSEHFGLIIIIIIGIAFILFLKRRRVKQ